MSFDEQILIPTTFYCTHGGNDRCVERFVNGTATDATDCCSYLNLTGTGSDRKSECTNNGT